MEFGTAITSADKKIRKQNQAHLLLQLLQAPVAAEAILLLAVQLQWVAEEDNIKNKYKKALAQSKGFLFITS